MTFFSSSSWIMCETRSHISINHMILSRRKSATEARSLHRRPCCIYQFYFHNLLFCGHFIPKWERIMWSYYFYSHEYCEAVIKFPCLPPTSPLLSSRPRQRQPQHPQNRACKGWLKPVKETILFLLFSPSHSLDFWFLSILKFKFTFTITTIQASLFLVRSPALAK